MCEHMAPCARKAHGKHSHGSGSTPAFRTRMDFAACCMSQGLSLAPTRPRSCELSPGHALGPSARVAGVCPCPLSRDLRSSLGLRSGIVAATRIPLPRNEDDRHAPLTGAGWPINFPIGPAKSTAKEQSPTTIFSENQKCRRTQDSRAEISNPHPEEARSAVSKDEGRGASRLQIVESRASPFETRFFEALLRVRVWRCALLKLRRRFARP